MKKTIAALLLIAGAAQAQTEGKDFTKETAEAKTARMQWFNEARFGMFIHWGLYSQAAGEIDGKKVGGAGEWIMETGHVPVSTYEKLVPQFNPVKFNAREWAHTAKQAGMKYLVITSKHHDGFGIWRSPSAPDWSMSATPYAGDPLKDLAAACKEEGIRFCLYHSIMDWHHPDWGTRRKWNDRATGTPDMDRYDAYLKGQLKELLTGYGPIGLLWFDGEWESPWTHERGVDLYNYCRGLQPDVIINNRVGKGRAGMNGMDKGNAVGDYGTPEQQIPATGFGPGVSWESCMTMNGTWGFRKDDNNWKSTTTLIRNLIDCASKGGNYLLNVGPTGEGLIPFASVVRLQQVGEWMKVNSDAIYGTTASPFKSLPFGRCTVRGNRLFLHVFDAPADGQLRLPGLQTKIGKAWMMADAKTTPLPISMDGTDPVVVLPNYPPCPLDANATVICVDLEGPAVVETAQRQQADGKIVLAARDAKILGTGPAGLEDGEGKNNIGYWSARENAVEWTFRVLKPGTFKVTIDFACKPESAGTAYTVAVAGATLRDSVESTGAWTTYAARDLGTVKIAKEGLVTLTVSPAAQPKEGLMNLRSVTLTPAE